MQHRLESNDDLTRSAKFLELFLDTNITDETPFAKVKRQAAEFLPANQTLLDALADTLRIFTRGKQLPVSAIQEQLIPQRLIKYLTWQNGAPSTFTESKQKTSIMAQRY